MPRPQDHYRERLLHELAALKPERVLEVGCGSGAFLRGASALGLGIALEGIDPDESCVAKLRDEGFAVRVGQAQKLDLADASVDVVVFSFTAHHIADWHAALLEALRVSRRAVLILDPWYDMGLASQSVAAAFDRWCKAIDRSTGMVHNDCMDAKALLAPIEQQLSDFSIRVDYMLVLQELGLQHLAGAAEAQLRQASEPGRWQLALDLILHDAQAHGFSDDGAILLAINRNEHPPMLGVEVRGGLT